MFLYNGTTYAPIRAVCEAAGMEVSYDSATDTVELVTADRVASQKPESSSYITQSRAKEIALADAGVKAANAVFLKGQPGTGMTAVPSTRWSFTAVIRSTTTTSMP